MTLQSKATTQQTTQLYSWAPKQTPFRCCIRGISGQGKSHLLVSMLHDPKALKGRFDHIFYVSPTLLNDPVYDSIDITSQNWTPEPSMEFIDNIRQLPGSKLIIIDDTGSSFKRNDKFDNMFTNCRHDDISIIILAQDIKQLSTITRGNLTCLITFNITSKEELEIIHSNFGGQVKKEQLFSLLANNLKNKDFAVFDRTTGSMCYSIVRQ